MYVPADRIFKQGKDKVLLTSALREFSLDTLFYFRGVKTKIRVLCNQPWEPRGSTWRDTFSKRNQESCHLNGG